MSIFKGTWFERSHLDIDTNLRFCWLYLTDYFSYDLARTEIRGISNTSICDWASFVREVVNHNLNFVDPKTKAHTNTIERKWRDLKNAIPRFGRRQYFFIEYLAMTYFKFHFQDKTTRMHAFMTPFLR